MYELFLLYLRDFFIESYQDFYKGEVFREEEIYQKNIWKYIVLCTDEHKLAIENLMQCGYKISDCFLREVLSWDYPIIFLYEEEKYIQSLEGKSDLAPTITFLLPNIIGTEHLSPNRFMRIEFSIGGMPWTYY